MLRKELILLDMDCNTSEEVIRTLAKKFVESGVVRDSFIEAVAEREKLYPTALPASAFDIAIPHTMAEHVNIPAMGVGILRRPVAFCQMGSPEITLHPRLVFMLAIKDPKEQIGLLRRIMKLIQNEKLLSAIKNAASADEVFALLNGALE